jgi:hypothetical protein
MILMISMTTLPDLSAFPDDPEGRSPCKDISFCQVCIYVLL